MLPVTVCAIVSMVGTAGQAPQAAPVELFIVALQDSLLGNVVGSLPGSMQGIVPCAQVATTMCGLGSVEHPESATEYLKGYLHTHETGTNKVPSSEQLLPKQEEDGCLQHPEEIYVKVLERLKTAPQQIFR